MHAKGSATYGYTKGDSEISRKSRALGDACASEQRLRLDDVLLRITSFVELFTGRSRPCVVGRHPAWRRGRSSSGLGATRFGMAEKGL
jgi:hypothetical protein